MIFIPQRCMGRKKIDGMPMDFYNEEKTDEV